MSSRTVNLTLLVLVSAIALSGIGSFLVGDQRGSWVFWTHRIASFGMLPLLIWKSAIVFSSYRKRGVTAMTVLSGMSAILFLLAFVYGVLWATTGVGGGRLPILGSTSGLGLHVTFGICFVPLFLIHVINRWPQVRGRVPDFANRRAAIRYAVAGLVGLITWQASETATARAGWEGAERRFTGSKIRGRFSGNDYPTVNWLSDPRPVVDPNEWHLRVDGLVQRELTISFDAFNEYVHVDHDAILDCTGGWYSEQRWRGVRLADLLDDAGVDNQARSVVVHSETGYRRRYSVRQARSMLLAIQVTDETLSRGHGFPVRLVAPGHRGYGWVKWVVRIELSDLPGWLESPLPLQ
jgi:DMSO/TMAO reductase YedYZ molybdopterin-dependent catalytic subunit